ncbi:Uncharacterized protein TCM_020068 [Theobroma cacao]|uniref:Transmembrane protein n=1 Tax=Theobroma cacao TaxID=3641 RepID=A0A061EJT5_THECC|nr:Uncharacterized protein TCM_020068 [Theobroma cacao]
MPRTLTSFSLLHFPHCSLVSLVPHSSPPALVLFSMSVVLCCFLPFYSFLFLFSLSFLFSCAAVAGSASFAVGGGFVPSSFLFPKFFS